MDIEDENGSANHPRFSDFSGRLQPCPARNQTRVDCRDKCFACGILPKFIEERRATPADAWQCPEVKPIHLRGNSVPQTSQLIVVA